MLNIFEIREDLWSIKLPDCTDVDNDALWIDWKVIDYNLCGEPTAPSTTDTDTAHTDSAKTLVKMSEQELIFDLLRGIPRNNECKCFLGLIMDENAKVTTAPHEIVTKLLEMEAAIKRENGVAPDALLLAKTGGRGGRGGKVGKSPKRDKRDDMRDNMGDNDRKQKDLRKCFHCQRRGHITENCWSKQYGDPPKSADTAAKASTETTSTLATSATNYWMVAS